MAVDDRRAETCSSATTPTGSNRGRSQSCKLDKAPKEKSSVHVWKSLGRDHPDLVSVKKRQGRLIGSTAGRNMGKSTRKAATTLEDIRR